MSSQVEADISVVKDLLAKGYKFTFEKEPVFRKIQAVKSLNLTFDSSFRFDSMLVGEIDVLSCYRKKNLKDKPDVLTYIVKKRGINWAAVSAGGAMRINVTPPGV